MNEANPRSEVCEVCGGRKSACAVLGHRPPGDRTQWRDDPVSTIMKQGGETLRNIQEGVMVSAAGTTSETGCIGLAELFSHSTDDDKRQLAREVMILREALQKIADLAIAPMVDMADPPEDQAHDWAHVAALAWDIAREALSKRLR